MKNIIIIILITSSLLFSQRFKFGGRVEPSFSFGSTSTRSEEYKSLTTRSSDIRVSLSLIFPSKFILSFRPGIVLGSNYGGMAAGLFGSIHTYQKWYTLIGFDLMKPMIGDGGHHSGSKDVLLPYPVIGTCYRLNENLSFELQFHYSLNQITYAYNARGGSFPSYDYEYYKVYWLIKLSVGFNS